MKTRSLHLGLLLAALALVVACSGSDAAGRQYQPQDRPYFTGSIPPCTPVEGGAVGPVRPHRHGQAIAGLLSPDQATARVPQPISLGLSQMLVQPTWCCASRFCRGPCAARYGRPGARQTWSGLRDLQATGDELGKITCYVDVRVNEYILGTGPPTLTLLLTEVRAFR